jgi:hypothetical protein
VRTPVCLGIAACLFAALLPRSPAADDPPKPPPGFTALFNGKDLTGWEGHVTMAERAKYSPETVAELRKKRTEAAREHWSAKEGVIVLDGKPSTKWVVDSGGKVVMDKGTMGLSLVTAKDYGNFELYVDWKIEKNGDSGIYLRGQPQVQIWDSDNSPGARGVDKGSGSGGLWNNPLSPEVANSKNDELIRKEGMKIGKIPLKKADKPLGEWNRFRIIMVGEEVTVYLNGELVVDKAKLPNYWEKGKPLPEKGPIELQYHGDPLWFKNIYVKELP